MRRWPAKQSWSTVWPLAGQTVLEHSLGRLLAHPCITGAVLVLAPDDERWAALGFQTSKPLLLATGGALRAESVVSGLQLLQSVEPSCDWVLVHDGARPCVSNSDIERLISAGQRSANGAILATPLVDTLKRVEQQMIQQTLPRNGLYCAQTPQMFRPAQLLAALAAAGVDVTDEASAMEQSGLAPQVVTGSATNIKVTVPADLLLATALLESGACE